MKKQFTYMTTTMRKTEKVSPTIFQEPLAVIPSYHFSIPEDPFTLSVND